MEARANGGGDPEAKDAINGQNGSMNGAGLKRKAETKSETPTKKIKSDEEDDDPEGDEDDEA
jgi:hypothetical protein